GAGGRSRSCGSAAAVAGAPLAPVGRRGGPDTVGSGTATPVAELHRACAHVAGSDAPPRVEEARLGDVQRSVLDVSRIERELGWRPHVSLADGLARTWAWTKEALAA